MKRFPFGLTVAAIIGVAILLGLGFWQVKRLGETRDELARIAALRTETPRPLGEVLAEADHGRNVRYVRVTAACETPRGNVPTVYRYSLRDGRVGWRLMSDCPLSGGPWAAIVLDRGLVTRFDGQMAPVQAAFPAPVNVTGVLRAPGVHGFLDAPPLRGADGSISLEAVDAAALRLVAGGARVAPWYLAVESEAPATPGLAPAPLPEDIPNNNFVYALTWFGLAGVLVWMWGAYVWRWARSR